MSEVDFWNWPDGCDVAAMKLKHDERLYPPKIITKWVPKAKPHDCCKIPITIIGCVGEGLLDSDIILPLGTW